MQSVWDRQIEISGKLEEFEVKKYQQQLEATFDIQQRRSIQGQPVHLV